VERRVGQDPLYNMYVTVFGRNAAYLTQLLTKASKIRSGNKNFGFECPFWDPLEIDVFKEFAQATEPNQSIFPRGDFSKVSLRRKQQLLLKRFF
jgi:hypothetical protein